MLSPEQERCRPSRSGFWLSAEGLQAFVTKVRRLAPREVVEPARARDELLLALRATDFAEAHDVDSRVDGAARVLAERLQAETYRIATHRQFATQPQPFRPDVVYGAKDDRVRDALDNDISTTQSHGYFAQYLREQHALNRPPRAAEWGERYSQLFS